MRRTKKLLILLLILIILSFTGCKHKKNSVVVAPIETIEDTTTTTDTPITKKLEIDGFEQYKVNENTNDTKDVSLVASLIADARLEDKQFQNLCFYKVNNTVIIAYTLADYTLNNDYDYKNAKYEVHLATIDKDTFEIIKEVTVPNATYTEYMTDGIWCMNALDDVITGCFYDENLTKITDFKLDKNQFGCFSSDGHSYYYIENQELYQCRFDNGKVNKSKIECNRRVSFRMLEGAYTDTKKNDYVVAEVIVGDLKKYNAIVNTSSGEVIYLQPEEIFYDSKTTNGTYIGSCYDAASGQQWGVCRENEPICVFSWPYETYVQAVSMKNGDVFFYGKDKDKIIVSIFDKETNLCKGSTEFKTTFELADDMSAHCPETPFYLDDNRVFIPVSDIYGNKNFFVWNVQKNNDFWDKMSATTKEIDAPVFLYDDDYDPLSYTPHEISDVIKPLRERADKLQERFDINILLSGECSNILDDYAITALDNYDQVKFALDIIERELSKYPEGFIKALQEKLDLTLDIYVAGSLIGVSDNSVASAAGFQTEIGNKTLIVIDGTYDDMIDLTINHEICHVIEDLLDLKQMINYDEWSNYNPYVKGIESPYTYSYNQFGYEEMNKYTFSGATDYNDVYFVDDYSMTYPNEDRARIFENIMKEDSIIPFEQTPHLVKKMNYFANKIRACFDTTGWNNVIWERYLQ